MMTMMNDAGDPIPALPTLPEVALKRFKYDPKGAPMIDGKNQSNQEVATGFLRIYNNIVI